jgi:Transglutaminase-like superfamily
MWRAGATGVEALVRFVALGRELTRALMVLPRAELVSRRLGPRPAAAAVRRIGSVKRRRSPADRARLQRAIRWADRLYPGKRTCYRRVLLEMALDSGAASEALMLGFQAGGAPGSGHAWLGSHDQGHRYDAVISV